MTTTVRQHVTDEHGATLTLNNARAWRHAHEGLLVPDGSGGFVGDGLLRQHYMQGTPTASTEFAANKAGLVTRITSGTTSGDVAMVRSLNPITSRNCEPDVYLCFSLESVANIRLFAGLFETATDVYGADNPTDEVVGIQFSTSRGDVNLMWAEDSGAGFTTTSSAHAPVAATFYVVALKFVANNASVRVGLWSTSGMDSWTRRDTRILNTTIPGTGTALYAGISVETLTGASKYVDVQRLQVSNFVANNL